MLTGKNDRLAQEARGKLTGERDGGQELRQVEARKPIEACNLVGKLMGREVG
jgi:hypothetical protein